MKVIGIRGWLDKKNCTFGKFLFNFAFCFKKIIENEWDGVRDQPTKKKRRKTSFL